MEEHEGNSGEKKGLMRKAMELTSTQEKRGGLLSKASHLKAHGALDDAIVDREGVFFIREGLETSSVKQDPALKELIDSVLEPQSPKA